MTLLERQARVGKKLLATGNGRCNLSNLGCSVAHYHGSDPGFAEQVLAQLPVTATLELFHSLGVCTTVEEGGWVYPLTGQASTVLDVLRYEVARLGVTVRLEAPVEHLSREGSSFLIRWPGGEQSSDRVIVAAGGRAAPQLGGTGDGVDLLQQLGHTSVSIFPGLVPLKTTCRHGRQLKGVKVAARAELGIGGEPADCEQGEILFTEYGLSGIPILQLSLAANRARKQGQPVSVSLDLLPTWSMEQLERHLVERLSRRAEAPLDFALVGLVHKRLIPVLLREASIADVRQLAGKLSPEQVGRIARLLKGWTFEVSGTLSWNHAQVMVGGIGTRDFDPASLESRLVQGLFAAGEVLDITGDCGGFNLQWAWSSGHVAGVHAAGV